MHRIAPKPFGNRGITLLFATFALAFAAFSQTLPQGVQRITSVEGITEYAFPNGLHVLLFPDASKPKVTVNMTYLVGSRHEGYGETGMAHLLEHLLFLQTKTRTNVKKELTDHGAEMNGSTSWDRTNYFETLTASDENLKYAIELEADRMVNTKMEKAILDGEMTVVRSEFEMGENSPSRMLVQRVLETAFTWHNYGKLPIGNRSDIEGVPIERLAAFYQKYYQPDNAILTIAGKFDDAKTLALVAGAFGGLPKPQRTLEKSYTMEPTQDGERSVTLRRVGDTQGIAVLYHVPAATHPDAPALEVLAGVLGDSPSGRLYKALVDNKKTVSASMGMEELHDPGFLLATATLRQDQSLDDARQALLKTVEGLVNEPPSKEEVERVKTRLLKQIELEMADSQAIALDLSEYAFAGRLAPDVPHARPPQGHHGTGCAARRQGLPEGVQPHHGHVHSHQGPRTRRDTGGPGHRRHAQGFQRHGGHRPGRIFRSDARQYRVARGPLEAARRSETCAVAEEDARRHRDCNRHGALRR